MDNQVILLVVIGTVGLMLMAFIVVFFVWLYQKKMLENRLKFQEMETKHQRDLLKATLESIEKERSRIGTDLHDSVGAMLSTIKMSLQVSNQPEDIKSVVSDLNETIGTVRGISHQMMPIILKKYGLVEAISELRNKVKGLEVEVEYWDEHSFTEHESLMIYRIIQECLNNAIKHSQASTIQLSGRLDVENFTICIKDDGVGFPEEIIANTEGMGLLNIINRAQALDAKAEFSNESDKGALIKLVIPTSIG